MKFVETDLPGCLVVEPRVFTDSRGWFYESFNAARWPAHESAPAFVQSNVSRSARGVLRGLHYQWPAPQGKLLSVLDGEIWDVAVDIRRGSPAFGQWTAVVLSAENRRHLWIPEGFAHGFVALSEQATVNYLCTTAYDPAADASVRWDDPTLAIDWPISAPLLSEKDANAPVLTDIEPERLPMFAASSA